VKKLLITLLAVSMVAGIATAQAPEPLTNFAFVNGRMTVTDTGATASLHTGLALQPWSHVYGFISAEGGGPTAGAYADIGYLFGSRKAFIGPVVGLVDIVTNENMSQDPAWYWINASGIIAGTTNINAYAKYKAKLTSAASFPQGWCFGLGIHFPIKLPF
jgi:hypothetical protein